MTESEWLESADPREMLDHVRGQVSARKLRWFACACVREVWPLLLDARSQTAVEVAERYADGRATVSQLATAEMDAFEVARIADLRATVSDPGWAATRAAARAASLDAHSAASGAAFIAALCAAPWAFDTAGTIMHHGDAQAKARARRVQCDLLREIVGNPFHLRRFALEQLPWDDGSLSRLAQNIYDEGRLDDLPILADALEDAGCTDTVLLEHLRRPGKHVRGCWVLDLVLNRG